MLKGVKLTEQRKIIAKVMSEANDHPDVDELYKNVFQKLTLKLVLLQFIEQLNCLKSQVLWQNMILKVVRLDMKS